MRSDETPKPILHLAHPSPSPWARFIKPLTRRLNVPLVPYSEWLSALESKATDDVEVLRENPALRVLDFFRNSLDYCSGDHPGREAMGIVRMDVAKAQSVAPVLSLSSAMDLGSDCAERWLEAWQRSGFMPTSSS